MKNYYRVMLGRGHMYAQECFVGGFIGADFGIHQDLTPKLPEDWHSFNHEFIPIYQQINHIESKVSAGLACGALWTISKGIRVGDIVLCPDGESHYHVGEVIDEYRYQPDGDLPHRRAVRWLANTIARDAMSEQLRRSTGSIGTVSNISGYASELELLIGKNESTSDSIPAIEPEGDNGAAIVENAIIFRMEKYLEEFMVDNWHNTPFGQDYDIYEDEDGTGQQYQTDTGPLDILAISKDKKTLLVVELKKGATSDKVVGQILRYMGYVQDVLANSDQTVKGAIIALEG